MITVSQSVMIDAPIGKVFSVLADVNRIPEWRKEVPGISHVSGPAAIGSTFIEEVRFMGTKQLQMKITEYVPNKMLTIEAQEGMSLLPTQSFVLTEDGQKTKLDLTVHMKVKGFFTLMQPMLPSKLKKTWAKYFANLNQLVKQ